MASLVRIMASYGIRLGLIACCAALLYGVTAGHRLAISRPLRVVIDCLTDVRKCPENSWYTHMTH